MERVLPLSSRVEGRTNKACSSAMIGCRASRTVQYNLGIPKQNVPASKYKYVSAYVSMV